MLLEGLHQQAQTHSSPHALAGVGPRNLLGAARRVAVRGMCHRTRWQRWLFQRLIALTQQEEIKSANQEKN